MTWYYAKDGEQKGPITEEELNGLFSSGELTGDDLVWKEGMDEWSAYQSVFGQAGSDEATALVNCPTCGAQVSPDELIPAGDTHVCPNCRDTYAQGIKEGISKPVAAPGSRGTGGTTPNKELRAMAREALTGKWGLGIGVTFLGFFLMIICAFVPILGPIAQWVITGPLMFGFLSVFLKISRQEEAEVGVLFSGFSHFGIAWLIYFVVSIFAGLVGLAAAIPGIVLLVMGFAQLEGSSGQGPNSLLIVGFIVAYIPALIASFYIYLRYALAMFIAIDDPDVGTMEALNLSAQRMKGRKGKLFMLGLSFIGWYLLGFLAFFIGTLFVAPYIATSIAAFYDDVGDGGDSAGATL